MPSEHVALVRVGSRVRVQGPRVAVAVKRKNNIIIVRHKKKVQQSLFEGNADMFAAAVLLLLLLSSRPVCVQSLRILYSYAVRKINTSFGGGEESSCTTVEKHGKTKSYVRTDFCYFSAQLCPRIFFHAPSSYQAPSGTWYSLPVYLHEPSRNWNDKRAA